MGARTWAVDYRLPPDHPYPVPLDDCVAAYRSMLKEYSAEEIVVPGASAGGNLAAALMLRRTMLWPPSAGASWAIRQYSIVCSSTLATRHEALKDRARAEGRLWDIDTGRELMIAEPGKVTRALVQVAGG